MTRINRRLAPWSNFPVLDSQGREPAFLSEAIESLSSCFRNPGSSITPTGNGRSYSDQALPAANGEFFSLLGCDRLIEFDLAEGRLIAQSGALLRDLNSFALPRGFFLPVCPGTEWVTLGGAIANDVHGKNHRSQGSFGEHVQSIFLARSDWPAPRWITRKSDPGLFFATIAGMGMTGVMLAAEILLSPIPSSWAICGKTRFSSLQGFFDIEPELSGAFEYTASWIDCAAKGSSLGRGALLWGKSSEHSNRAPEPARTNKPAIPPLPFCALTPLTVSSFNRAYFAAQHSSSARLLPLRAWLFPLDAIPAWNRFYGPEGFFQWQCLIPPQNARDALADILRAISDSGEGSFLAVLKSFSKRSSHGALSFAREGVSLALDFRRSSPKTLPLLARLDTICAQAQGALYPAKDSRLPANLFFSGFPQHQEWLKFRDPAIDSLFCQRIFGD